MAISYWSMRSTLLILYPSSISITVFILGVALPGCSDNNQTIPRIGATTIVTELNSGIDLEARVDTGATTCSLHCSSVEIQDESDDPAANLNKAIRCLTRNNRGETAWIDATIVGYSGVRTTSALDDRYFVELPIRVNELNDTVRVSLNDRSHMTYPFLVGRNFLRGNFVVDVRANRHLD